MSIRQRVMMFAAALGLVAASITAGPAPVGATNFDDKCWSYHDVVCVVGSEGCIISALCGPGIDCCPGWKQDRSPALAFVGGGQ